MVPSEMHPLTAAELLQIWEWGLSQPPVRRGLALLAAACPGSPPEALAELSAGQRDECLLALREGTFGSRLVGIAACPQCSERLELDFTAQELISKPPSLPDQGLSQEPFKLEISGWQVSFRLPKIRDLAAISGSADVSLARSQLLERCLVSVRRKGRKKSPADLPDEVVSGVLSRMSQADPLADIQLALACPACEHRWMQAFDVLAFFWDEIQNWALRTLNEIHLLASAYGWREADILALSPWRRQAYLEMVRG